MTFAILSDGLDRDAWLAARTQVVTATDVSRLIRGGAGTWAALRAEKNGYRRDMNTPYMQHGKDREPVIARYALAAFGLGHNTALLGAEDEPRFAATPDLLSDDETGDIKTTIHDWPALADVPGNYIDQILWQMRVTGRRRARLVFEPHDNFIPLHPFPRDFIIEWDQDRVEQLEQVALEFLSGETEPDADAALLDSLITEYVELEQIAELAAYRSDQAKLRVEEHIKGKPTRFEGSRANLTRSADSTRKSFDSTAFKKARPDLADEYTKESTVKGRLTITLRNES